MNRWRRASRLITVVLGWTCLAWLLLAYLTGCSRHVKVPASDATHDHSQLPFDHPSDGNGFSPTAAFAPESIPDGTEITIRLRKPLSSGDCRSGDQFDAVLDEPIIQAGKTILPRSSAVTGRVVATKASAGSHDPGYLRLTLASIAMNGKSITLHTSSIFAKGRSYGKLSRASVAPQSAGRNQTALTSPDAGIGTPIGAELSKDDITFSTGHRLTFRLAQALRLQN